MNLHYDNEGRIFPNIKGMMRRDAIKRHHNVHYKYNYYCRNHDFLLVLVIVCL